MLILLPTVLRIAANLERHGVAFRSDTKALSASTVLIQEQADRMYYSLLLCLLAEFLPNCVP